MPLVHNAFIPLWSDQVPEALPSQKEQRMLPDDDIPTLQVVLPTVSPPSGAAFIVCPGGGYQMLADYEGYPVAEWLATRGITAFVLRYRLGPRYTYPTQLMDVQRAIRLVRANAASWGLDAQRIGILGFSAGGHLSSLAATRYVIGDPTASDPVERVSSRPDLQVLIYPVISFELTYKPVSALLGYDPHPSLDLLTELSNELFIRAETPPAFLVHTTNDTVVPVENSDRYAAALAARDIPYEYIRGGFGEHGFGMNTHWTPQCMNWLELYGYTKGKLDQPVYSTLN